MGENSTALQSSSVPWRLGAPLYGGALECDIPESFSDISELRQVPDNQEVWADTLCDRSLIIEILERESEVPDGQAVSHFLGHLAFANEAREASVVEQRRLHSEEVPGLPEGVTCLLGIGEQAVAKFNEGCANRVQVHLAAIRLLEQETDILITLNDPVMIDPQSSSADAAVVGDGSSGAALFHRVLKSFKIKDWNLFGG